MKDIIRTFILQALKSADGEPLPDSVLRTAIRTAFSHVALTEHDLGAHIAWVEKQGWIIGTDEPPTGIHWTFTTKGKLRAAQL